MFAMKFRYSKFRHSASEPKEKRNELSLRSEIVGKTRRARSNGLCSASRRATWCSESRERSALDNLRHVYVHFAKPRPEKKRWKRWRIDEHDEPSQFRRSVKPFESRISFVARQICGAVRLLRNEHRITKNRSRIGESYGEIFAPNRYF